MKRMIVLAVLVLAAVVAGCGEKEQTAWEKAREAFQASSVAMCKSLGNPATCREAERFLETHTLEEAREIVAESALEK